MIRKTVIGLCLWAVLIGLGIGIGFKVFGSEPIPMTVEASCLQGVLMVHHPAGAGVVTIGEVEICGVELRISSVYGPSMEAYIEELEAKLESMR